MEKSYEEKLNNLKGACNYLYDFKENYKKNIKTHIPFFARHLYNIKNNSLFTIFTIFFGSFLNFFLLYKFLPLKFLPFSQIGNIFTMFGAGAIGSLVVLLGVYPVIHKIISKSKGKLGSFYAKMKVDDYVLSITGYFDKFLNFVYDDLPLNSLSRNKRLKIESQIDLFTNIYANFVEAYKDESEKIIQSKINIIENKNVEKIKNISLREKDAKIRHELIEKVRIKNKKQTSHLYDMKDVTDNTYNDFCSFVDEVDKNNEDSEAENETIQETGSSKTKIRNKTKSSNLHNSEEEFDDKKDISTL